MIKVFAALEGLLQSLNFTALLHNAQFFKKLLGKSYLCAVVKNNAYGHGIEHIARYLENIVDCFAVGSVDEARQIEFVSNDVILLLPLNEVETTIAINAGFVLTIDSFSTLKTVAKICGNLQKRARVHIKIDSGMSRLGFSQNDLNDLVSFMLSHNEISVEGIYSHFYGENITECDKQLSVFLRCAECVELALSKQLIKHIANSSGALLSNKYHLDMARIGLGLYGYGNSGLIPVKTVTAQVLAVKTINKNSVVGYGAKCIVARDTRIAVINTGYARGFSRSLVGSEVCINSMKCKVLAVCMAMIIVDVGNSATEVGDAVTLLGDSVNISNNITSVYELLCNLK